MNLAIRDTALTSPKAEHVLLPSNDRLFNNNLWSIYSDWEHQCASFDVSGSDFCKYCLLVWDIFVAMLSICTTKVTTSTIFDFLERKSTKQCIFRQIFWHFGVCRVPSELEPLGKPLLTLNFRQRHDVRFNKGLSTCESLGTRQHVQQQTQMPARMHLKNERRQLSDREQFHSHTIPVILSFVVIVLDTTLTHFETKPTGGCKQNWTQHKLQVMMINQGIFTPISKKSEGHNLEQA